MLEVRQHLSDTADEIAEAYELDMTPEPPRPMRPPPNGPLADVLGRLHALGFYQNPLGDGWHAITCPWAHEHSAGVASGTAYREPAPENGMRGAFRCHHGHCDDRKIGQLFRFLAQAAVEMKA